MMFTGRTILAILLVMAASTAAEASGKPRHRPRRRKHAAAPAPPRAPVKANVHPFYAGVDAEPVGTMHLLYTGLLDHPAPSAGLESVNATPDGIFWTEGNSLPSIGISGPLYPGPWIPLPGSWRSSPRTRAGLAVGKATI